VAFTCTEWLDGVMQTLDSNRSHLAEQLAEKLPLAGYRIPNCSYLAWIDLSAYQLGSNPSEVILEKGRVAFTPGYLFGAGCEGFIRMNFATSPELITEGIDRIVAAISAAK
jgi:cystathionine beta-lyase